ncbi:rhamnosyltransferase [Pseudomonas putida]|nr:rhamnosyltransferase [Pseudomonas putida]
MSRIGAVVVTYNPDPAVLDDLLRSLLNQVELLILMDNGGGQNFLKADAAARQQVYYVDLGGNSGLGVALNQGFEIAASRHLDYLVTFDQDSHANPDLIERLHAGMQDAISKDPQCIAVGPHFFDRREGEKVPFPFYITERDKIVPAYSTASVDGLLKVETLITSGMMVCVSAWVSGIKYNDGMFVDYTDTEWCFRARSLGHTLYGCLNVEMGHALSDAPPVKLFGLSFFEYSPVRRYFYFRNTVAVVRMEHTPALWKKRLMKGLLLRFFVNIVIDKQRFKSFAMMIRGALHGLSGKLGGLQ